MPASAMTSASPTFATVIPVQPDAICIFAMTGILWVLT